MHSASAATGTVVLRDLKLGWSPTCREGGEESDKERKVGFLSATKELCFCMSRAQRGPVSSATISASRTGRSTSEQPNSTGQNSKYQLLDTDDDETPNETAKIDAPKSEDVYADSGYITGHDADVEHDSTREDSHRSLRKPMAMSPSSPQHDLPTVSFSKLNSDCEHSAAVAPTIILDQTSFTIPRGALAVVVGVTGSGKSSLLQGALLGEGLHLSGIAAVGGRISYASQSAWIQNATLRDNVLFGTPYDKERYDKVVFSCALLSDFKLLPAGDMTEIGKSRAAINCLLNCVLNCGVQKTDVFVFLVCF
jgi:ABC-type multidrug transport system fused ATPase/permease subunit